MISNSNQGRSEESNEEESTEEAESTESTDESESHTLRPLGEPVTFVFRNSSAMRELMAEVQSRTEQAGGGFSFSARSVSHTWSNEFLANNPDAVRETLGHLSGLVVVDRSLEPFVAGLPGVSVIRAYDHWVSHESTEETAVTQLAGMKGVADRVRQSGMTPVFMANSIGDHFVLHVTKDPQHKEFKVWLPEESLTQESGLGAAAAKGLDFGSDMATASKNGDYRNMGLILKSALAATRLAESGEIVCKVGDLDYAVEGWKNSEDEMRERGYNFVRQIMAFIESRPDLAPERLTVLIDHHIDSFGVPDQLLSQGVHCLRACCCCVGTTGKTADKISQAIAGHSVGASSS